MLPPDQDRDVIYGLVRDIVATTMQERIADRQWDVPPTMLIVGELTGEDPTGLPSAAFISEPMPIPPSPHHPLPAVLELMARAVDAEPSPPPARWRRVVALVMLAEAYSLAIPEESTKAERQQVMDWCARHAIADHPWGVETKMVTAVDCYGTTYLTEYRRRDKDVPPIIDSYKGGERELEGRMPDAMSAVLAAISRRIDARSD